MIFFFRPLIQNKLEVLGKAGLSEDVLEADCTFFKVLITFPKHESSQTACEFVPGIHTILFVVLFVKGKGKQWKGV